MQTAAAKKLPSFFKPILWSCDYRALDLQKCKHEIAINSLNYGDLAHWRWIAQNYGKSEISEEIRSSKPDELRPGARRLAEIIFGSKDV